MDTVQSLSENQAVYLFAKSWNTLDPTDLIPWLDENVRYSSQNVLQSMNTADEVVAYLKAKMMAVKSAPENRVYAEIAETQSYPAAPNPAQPCVLLAQSDPNNLLAVVLIGVSKDKITSIDICSVAPHPYSVKRSGEYPR